MQAVSTATTCSLSKQVMSLVTTSTTALRGAATSLELAERRRGSTLSTRFLLCTARRSVDRLQTKVRAQSDGLAAKNHSRWVHFRKISSADAEKRRGKTKKYHRQGGGTRGGGHTPKAVAVPTCSSQWPSQGTVAVPSGRASGRPPTTDPPHVSTHCYYYYYYHISARTFPAGRETFPAGRPASTASGRASTADSRPGPHAGVHIVWGVHFQVGAFS